MVPFDVELSVAPSLEACKRVISSNSGRMKANANGPTDADNGYSGG